MFTQEDWEKLTERYEKLHCWGIGNEWVSGSEERVAGSLGTERKNDRDSRPFMIAEMAEKYNLNLMIQYALMVNFEKIFQNHGKFIIVKDNPFVACRYRDLYLQSGEYYSQEIEEDYLNILKEAFPNDEYGYEPAQLNCYMDAVRLVNIGKYDLKELSNNYPYVKLNKIKDIILHTRSEDSVYKLLTLLNNKYEEYQKNVLEIIKPISNEFTLDEGFGNTANLRNYLSGDASDVKNQHYWKNQDVNFYFLKEFDRLFEDMFMGYINEIDNDILERLVKAKKYVIDNAIEKIMVTSYSPVKVERPVTYLTEDRYGRKFYTTETIEKSEIQKFEVESDQKEIVLNTKKLLLTLIPMIINDNIDYCKLQELQMNEYLDGLLDTIGFKKQMQVKILKK